MTVPKLTKQDVKDFCAKVVEIVKKRWWIMLIELALLALIIVADQLTKIHVMDAFEKHGDPYAVMPGFLTLTYSKNTGAGFGMFKNSTVVLTAMTIIVVIAVLGYLVAAQKQTMWLRIPLIMIAAGGIGNSIDRIELGYVRDFMQFSFLEHFQYIFNVADCFVTVGTFMLVIVLVVMLVKEGRKNKKAFEEEQAKKVAGGHVEEQMDPLDAPTNLNPMLSSPNTYNFAEPASDESAGGTSDASGDDKAQAEEVESKAEDILDQADSAEDGKSASDRGGDDASDADKNMTE